MHCVAASEGFGQFVLDRALEALLDASDDFALKAPGEGAKNAKPCRSRQQLPKKVFSERCVNGVIWHIGALASHVLSATAVLALFMESMVEGGGADLGERLLLAIANMQREIIDALERGGPADARQTIEVHCVFPE
eukprot:8586411-Pyramimonas_sp.AAC.1